MLGFGRAQCHFWGFFCHFPPFLASCPPPPRAICIHPDMGMVAFPLFVSNRIDVAALFASDRLHGAALFGCNRLLKFWQVSSLAQVPSLLLARPELSVAGFRRNGQQGGHKLWCA